MDLQAFFQEHGVRLAILALLLVAVLRFWRTAKMGQAPGGPAGGGTGDRETGHLGPVGPVGSLSFDAGGRYLFLLMGPPCPRGPGKRRDHPAPGWSLFAPAGKTKQPGEKIAGCPFGHNRVK